VATGKQSILHGEPSRFFYYVSVPSFIVLVFLTCFPLNSCSKPEKGVNPDSGIDPNEVLALLLGIPPVPTPPETEFNSQNQSFQLTLGYCQDVAEYRYTSYDMWIQSLIDTNATTSARQDTVMWILPHSDGLSAYTLRVVTGDTLKFRLEWVGPAYQHGPSSWHEGWIVPAKSSGYINTETGIPMMYWWVENEYSVISCQRMWSYVLYDSIYGGGALYISEMNTGIFQAHWDTIGHGHCWGIGNSGDW